MSELDELRHDLEGARVFIKQFQRSTRNLLQYLTHLDKRVEAALNAESLEEAQHEHDGIDTDRRAAARTDASTRTTAAA